MGYLRRRRLPLGLEMGLLRVLLAVSVALSHLGGLFGYSMAGGHASVQMFYVISGFYMATILTEKYDPRSDVALFYSNRSLRIYSVYLVALVISLLAYGIIFAAGKGGWLDYVRANIASVGTLGQLWLAFTSLFIIGQDTTLFMAVDGGGLAFTPDGPGGPVPVWVFMPIPQAWTISLELMFYVLVPFLIRNRTRTLVALIVVSLAARFITYGAGYDNDPWLSRFFPFELALFVMGMVARRIYDARIADIPRHVQIGVALAFFAATLLMRPVMEALIAADITTDIVIWPYYASGLIALPCLFALTRNNKTDSAIGNYSYPVYLIHWVVMQFYDTFAAGAGLPGIESPLRVLICLAATFALSWLIIVSVEVPVDRYRQRRHAAQHAAVPGGAAG